MAWAKKPIDRMEMMHLLGLIYARTAAGFGKVALEKLIRTEGKASIKPKAEAIRMVLTSCGILLYEKNGKGRQYRWNIKEWGVVSLPIADAMIHEVERHIRRKGNDANKRKRAISLTSSQENDC